MPCFLIKPNNHYIILNNYFPPQCSRIFGLEPVFGIIKALSSAEHTMDGTSHGLFAKRTKAHNLYLPLSCKHADIDRGRPAACCLLCAAHLGISLMQGDAMKEQSDANAAMCLCGVRSCICACTCVFVCVCVCVCGVCVCVCLFVRMLSPLSRRLSNYLFASWDVRIGGVVCRLRVRPPNPLPLRTGSARSHARGPVNPLSIWLISSSVH